MNQRPTVCSISPNGAAHSGRIAFVEAGWHRDIVTQAYEGFTVAIDQLGVDLARIDRYEVPGSLELPLYAKGLADIGKHAVIIAAGLIVDGGIYRHDFVARTVLDGIMQVQLRTGVPVLSVVLTPHRFHDNEAHWAFFHRHLFSKGEEAAQACWQTLQNIDRLRALAAA